MAPASHTAVGILGPWKFNSSLLKIEFTGPQKESLQTPYHPWSWYIYLHLPYKKSTKCRQMYHTWMVWELSFLRGEMLKVGWGVLPFPRIRARHRHPPG